MIRYLLSVFVSLIIALAGGFFASEYIFKNFDGCAKLTIGQWQATPMAGNSDADPYAKAHRFRQNDLVLGRAEGLRFHAWRDEDGHSLDSNCSYRIIGQLPSFRLFTLYAVDEDRLPINAIAPYPFMLNSDDLTFGKSGEINIVISYRTQPENWLYITKNKKFGLVLTLYDTPVASETGLVNPVMPKIERIKDAPCD